ncbi:MAG: hypothetical protein CVT67_02890 [Actinobacteria bacterium HGW-Actinobacteria-7]|nr:MAG: hypothetical protein CVT67_02890 [Actinobacteria bacterium HGW-Actinobacteria-7]
MDDTQRVQELVDAVPDYIVSEKNEQTTEFAEWLIEEMDVTDASVVQEWSEDTWMGMFGCWYQGTDYQAESDAFWDWVEPRGLTAAQITNNPELNDQLRAEFHTIWLAQK